MNDYQFHLNSEIVLDARRAIWLPQSSVLAVADLHLGYAWAQRYAGCLLPVSGPDEALPRLQVLQEEYCPRQLVFIGDIVHRAVPVAALEQEFTNLVKKLGTRSEVIFVRGNHDKDLERLLRRCRLPVEWVLEHRAGPHVLLHGDSKSKQDAEEQLAAVRKNPGRIFIGHEHPATSIGDGVTTALKCPCFLVSEEVIVLPAFSSWAAGSTARDGNYMSALAQRVTFTGMLPILDGRFLPMLSK